MHHLYHLVGSQPCPLYGYLTTSTDEESARWRFMAAVRSYYLQLAEEAYLPWAAQLIQFHVFARQTFSSSATYNAVMAEFSRYDCYIGTPFQVIFDELTRRTKAEHELADRLVWSAGQVLPYAEAAAEVLDDKLSQISASWEGGRDLKQPCGIVALPQVRERLVFTWHYSVAGKQEVLNVNLTPLQTAVTGNEHKWVFMENDYCWPQDTVTRHELVRYRLCRHIFENP